MVPTEETCLFLFEAPSIDDVRAAGRLAALPIDHVVETAPSFDLTWRRPEMKRFARFDVLVLAAVLAALGASPLVQQGRPRRPSTGSKCPRHKPFLVGHAVGVQIYRCDPVSGGYRWNPVAPRADLYGDNGQLLATHFAGPTWLARDGSRVVGTVDNRVTVDPSAIPWLRLSAASTAPTATGSQEPRSSSESRRRAACPGGGHVRRVTLGETAEVPYTADYVFWKTTGQ